MNKNCTDIEQSKKLIELGLDVNTADMWYLPIKRNEKIYYDLTVHHSLTRGIIPAWSLAALLRELPDAMLGKDKDGYVVMVETMGSGLTTFASNPIDACYEMIIKLKELKLL